MKYPDLIGKTFGRLTVLEKIPRLNRVKYPNTNYKCKCVCGSEIITIGCRLRAGHVKSCGCLQTEARASNGRANKLKAGNATRNLVVKSYRKQCAQNRGHPCTLTDAEFDELFSGDCFYCGSKPHKTVKYGNCVLPFTFNGIDRLDNGKGYVPGNVVSCCEQCNKAKRHLSVSEFYNWIRLVYANIHHQTK